MVGKRRIRRWSCEGHVEEFEDVRPIVARSPGPESQFGGNLAQLGPALP